MQDERNTGSAALTRVNHVKGLRRAQGVGRLPRTIQRGLERSRCQPVRQRRWALLPGQPHSHLPRMRHTQRLVYPLQQLHLLCALSTTWVHARRPLSCTECL